MAWPPSLSNHAGFAASGVTTIVWGTGGFETGALANYIVKSVRPSERIEEIHIENHDGLTATNILLKDGINYDVTVVDNSNVTPPTGGDIIALIIPQMAANGNGITNTTVNLEVVENSYNAARKQEGERIIVAKSYTLISL